MTERWVRYLGPEPIEAFVPVKFVRREDCDHKLARYELCEKCGVINYPPPRRLMGDLSIDWDSMERLP